MNPDWRRANAAFARRNTEDEPVPWRPFCQRPVVKRPGRDLLVVNFYPVNDEQDRQWARRLEWVVEQHRYITEDDLEEMETEMHKSKEGIFRKYDQDSRSTLLLSTGGLTERTRPCGRIGITLTWRERKQILDQ